MDRVKFGTETQFNYFRNCVYKMALAGLQLQTPQLHGMSRFCAKKCNLTTARV